ncbi:MAG: hypothetical protein P4L92_00825 [Rudaea sp.]|nr:hypothetical protein [Rudaea sp.]
MNMQALLIRATMLFIMGFGLTIAMTHQNPAQGKLPAAPTVATMNVAVATTQAPAVVLPTINVRPSAAEIAAAMNGETTEFDEVPDFVDAARNRPMFDTTVSLRSLRLDMPYYSFGKALPRVSKE